MAQKASGYTLSNNDARIVLGMIARGDRHHDIAAWFGVNQGRIAEVEAGSHGDLVAANQNLPPRGAPGVKGKRLRATVASVTELLAAKGSDAIGDAIKHLAEASRKYDADEA